MTNKFSHDWSHDDLANDLAQHLLNSADRMVWVDMQIGPAGSPRPDVYTAPKSYSSFRPISYECKVSVADFNSDIRSGKWQNYFAFSSGVVFAVPVGLITKDDIPKGCGLMVRSTKGWTTVKAPKLELLPTLPKESWIKLLIDGVERSVRNNDQSYYFKHQAQKSIQKQYGADVAKALHDRDEAIRIFNTMAQEFKQRGGDLKELENIRRVKEHLKRDQESLKEDRRELCLILGLPENSTQMDIYRSIQLHRKLFKNHEHSQLFLRSLDAFSRSIGQSLSDLNKLSQAATGMNLTPQDQDALNNESPDFHLITDLLNNYQSK